MIQKYVDRCMAAGKSVLPRKHPESYAELVKWTIEAIRDPDEYNEPDPERIHVIDDGDYQGTLLFVIGATGYQPDQYWCVKVNYGSCSGCDTLQSIRDDYSNFEERESVTDEQAHEYWMLALHLVQGLKELP